MNIGTIPAKIARLDPAREALIDVDSGRRMTFGALDERLTERLVVGSVHAWPFRTWLTPRPKPWR